MVGPRRLANGTINHAVGQSGTGQTSFSVTLPATAQAGNVLVALVGVSNAASVVNTPAGWTRVGEHADASAAGAVTFWRVADGTETGLAVTTTTTTVISISLWEAEGADTTTPTPNGTGAGGAATSGSTATTLTPFVGSSVFARVGRLTVAHLHAGGGNLGGDTLVTDRWVSVELTAANRIISGASAPSAPFQFVESCQMSWATARRAAARIHAIQPPADDPVPDVVGSAAQNASGSSFTASLPTHQTGDLLLLAVNCVGAGITTPVISTPSGWTQRIHDQWLSGAGRFALFSRVAASGTEPAPQFTTDQAVILTWTTLSVRNASYEGHTLGPVGDSATATVPAHTSSGRSVALAFVVGGSTLSSTVTSAAPVLYTRERHDLGNNNVTSNEFLVTLQELTRVPAGQFPSYSVGLSASTRWQTYHVSLSNPTIPGALAVEQDVALAGQLVVTVQGSQAIEHDEALAGAASGAATVAGTQAIEHDEARSGTAAVTVAGTLAIEHDEARAGLVSAAAQGTTAVEHDEAGAGTAALAVPGVTAVEQDEALAGPAHAVVAGSPASEHDEAGPGSVLVTAPGTLAVEQDEPLGAGVLTVLGSMAVEVTEALAPVLARCLTAGPAAQRCTTSGPPAERCGGPGRRLD